MTFRYAFRSRSSFNQGTSAGCKKATRMNESATYGQVRKKLSATKKNAYNSLNRIEQRAPEASICAPSSPNALRPCIKCFFKNSDISSQSSNRCTIDSHARPQVSSFRIEAISPAPSTVIRLPSLLGDARFV